MANKVDIDAIRKAARMLAAEDGPAAYLRNVQDLLSDNKLPSGSLTFFGGHTVTAHNESVDGHLDNVKSGAQHLKNAAEQLEQAAKNWEKSDQPWVVK